MTTEVRLNHAVLEDDEELGTGRIILRGVVDQTTLKFIHLDWYQREQGFSNSHTAEIMGAYFAGNKVADITVGMRGQRCNSRGETYVLRDKCFCIDGGQRLYAAALAVKERPDLKIYLGAKVFLDTTEEFENDLFCRLGTTQVRISPSVLIRNRKKKSPAANLLVAINKHPDFALKDRIGWDQVKTRHELMNGFTLARVVAALHYHKGGPLKSYKPYELLSGLDALILKISEETVQLNIVRFFDAIDKCWTIRHLEGYGPQLKPLFLQTIAKLFSNYPMFWDKNDFYFADKNVRRLKGFKLADY